MSNGNQTLAGGSYAHSNAPAVDLELRLGWGPSEADQRSPPFGVHICSHCSKPFSSLQALGGHQTAHRREMGELRRRQDAKETTPLHDHSYMGGGTRSFVGVTHQLDSSTSRKGIFEPEAMRFVNLELRLGAMENEIDLTLGL